MGSIAAKKVAEKVIEKVGKGELPSVSRIAREVGYSKSTSHNPQKITETKTYKKIIGNVVDNYLNEEQRILDALKSKKLNKEKYKDLVDSVDKIRKNIQILSGGRTGNETIVFNWQNGEKD